MHILGSNALSAKNAFGMDFGKRRISDCVERTSFGLQAAQKVTKADPLRSRIYRIRRLTAAGTVFMDLPRLTWLGSFLRYFYWNWISRIWLGVVFGKVACICVITGGLHVCIVRHRLPLFRILGRL